MKLIGEKKIIQKNYYTICYKYLWKCWGSSLGCEAKGSVSWKIVETVETFKNVFSWWISSTIYNCIHKWHAWIFHRYDWNV